MSDRYNGLPDLPYDQDISQLECDAIESCADEPVFLCKTCGLSEPYYGFEGCLQCEVAAMLVEDPDYLDLARQLRPGTEWLRKLEREWERQLSARVECGYALEVA